MSSILMLGIENDLANQLSQALLADGHTVQTIDSVERLSRRIEAEVVFAGGDGPDYRDTVIRLKRLRPGLPVVLVNRVPENTRWLDALDLGADDYCGAPFEAVQVRWLLASVLRRSDHSPAAA